MRRTRTVLASVFFALVLIAGTCTQSAADECLAQPSGPTPQGQHWYYRIDHANGGRQCWYLRAESSRAQKALPKTNVNPADAMAQTIDAARPKAAAPDLQTPPEKKAPATVAPVPWLNVQRMPEPISSVPAAVPGMPEMPSQTSDAPTSSTEKAQSPSTAESPLAVPSRPALTADGGTTNRSKDLQRRQQAQARPEPPAPAIVQVDHTFALLTIVFVGLAIAGPALHLVERRRRRNAIKIQPPRWARVVALNAPTPRVRVPMTSRAETGERPAPMPISPPEQTERLAHALQQLVDRLRSTDRPEPEVVRMREKPRAARRASM